MTISATTRGLRPGVCTSTTRPGSPFDGQLIYETDTNRVAVYDTNTWVYKTPASTTGSVLQVVQTVKSDTFSTSSTSYTDVTGLTVTITPSSTSSKVLIMAHVVGGGGSGAGDRGIFRFNGGNSSSFVGASAGSRLLAWGMAGHTNVVGEYVRATVATGVYLDSPATTSATTYAVQTRSVQGTNYVNRTETDTDANTNVRYASSITVMEIAG